MQIVSFVKILFKESVMYATLSTRKATIADIPFLARIQYEASLPPLNQCFWEELLQDTGTSTLPFIEVMLKAGASNWGNVADSLILEEQGKPVAAAAGYTPNPEDYCPLQLSCLGKIAQDLNWHDDVATTFCDRYLQFWGGDCRPIFLTPQAPWIIEYVAVLPKFRGRGFSKILLKALIEEGKLQQHSHAGIMVIHGNDVALHTYESFGFNPYQTFHAGYFRDQFDLEFPGITKFTLRSN
jgi:GNAT superfamily N-acetyltransferase